MALSQFIPTQRRKPIRSSDLPPADDPFFYGWREVEHRINGIEHIIREPLTLEDVLHPQPGDYIVQNKEHFEVCDDLFDGLKGHLLPNEPKTVLLHDTLIDWEIIGLKPLCPDLAVVRHVQTSFPKGTFYLKQSQGVVDFILEVTSPSTWKVDREGYRDSNKVTKYAKAGVPCYVIVDDAHRKAGQSPTIIAYRLAKGKKKRYERIEPDKRGWYWIETIQLWIGPYRDWVSWYDKEGNKIGTYLEEFEGRKRAEEQAREQAEARKLAEDKARDAEDKAREQAEARKLAEDRAREQAEARKLAEDRIRELEALLRKAS